VPYFYHAYNLYLQIAIEQGILGTAGFLWLAACAVWYSGPWRAKEWTFHRAAVHASIITLLIYGLFDSETYESVLMPLSFIPIGAAFALTIEPVPVRDFVRRRMRSRLNIIGICLMIAVPLGLWFHPASIEARWHANLGAVSQTRVELRYYEWPKWPIQDLMRLQYKTELAQARQHYQQALGINPQEPVANRRLGQIELSLGEYASAQQHLENAYTAMPRHRAARQLLGESYAIAGDVEKAADLWRGMEFRQNQLSLRGWWYQFIGENQLAAHIYNAQTLSGH
jgi:tetratricopeptide (TPR) repeat protein